MSSSNGTTATSAGGIGFGGLLTILFITLKLCGVIHWSWLWVLAPFWIPIVLAVGFFLIVAIIGIIAVSKTSTRNRRLSIHR